MNDATIWSIAYGHRLLSYSHNLRYNYSTAVTHVTIRNMFIVLATCIYRPIIWSESTHSFCNTDLWGLYYKPFYGRNLRILVIS
jgi:hypothetical protein